MSSMEAEPAYRPLTFRNGDVLQEGDQRKLMHWGIRWEPVPKKSFGERVGVVEFHHYRRPTK